MIGQTIGHYRILEEIGRGGMGVVYRARDENLRRDVAVKLLPPSTLANLASRQRTRREALALSRLNHPAVAVIHDRISTPECDCIVMELVDGEPLDRILNRGPLSEPEALRLGIQLADGLAAAHAAGVIHRDLKPGNLRITSDGRLKILDFGLAKRAFTGSETTDLDVSESGAVVGTARYVPPELWMGESASERSDLYAAGVILYEMGCGQHPFEDVALAGFAKAAIAIQPPTPRHRNPSLSPGYEAIVLRCMEKNPENRMASARDLSRELNALHGSHAHGVETAQTRRRLPKAIQRGMVLAAGLLVIGAAVMAGVQQRWWPFAGPTLPIHSLAVLPLANQTGDPGKEYLADGMTDELISNLAEIPSLRVISRTSAMAYKDTKKPLTQIAHELGVDAVVQGIVTLAKERVRISLQLIDGRNEQQLWSKHYAPDDAGDALVMAHSITRDIGARLKEHAPPGPAHEPNPVAANLYLQGRFEWNRRSEDGIRGAIRCFTAAIERDSLYAPAYSGLADAWATAGINGLIETKVAHPEAKRAALRALALDPGLSEGYVSLGNIQQNLDWDWDAAARSYRRAIALKDNNATAHHWLANQLALKGEFDEAMVEVHRAQELDPLSLPINVGAGAFLYYARHYEAALVELQRAMQMDSSSAMVNRAMAATDIQLGRDDDAFRAIHRWLEGSYPGEMPARAALAYRQGGIKATLRLLVGGFEARRKAGQYEPATHLAELYSLLGDRQEALRWLEVALRERDTQLNRLKVDPIFDPLRQEPRFQEVARQVGLSITS